MNGGERLLRRPYLAGDSNPDPPIKSQSQRGPEPNIDKKTQPFRGSLGFFFGNGRCMFCPGSGTKRAQAKTQPNESALALQAAFDDINIHKGRSVYYWFGLCDERDEGRMGSTPWSSIP